jgi:hypothetical protein
MRPDATWAAPPATLERPRPECSAIGSIALRAIAGLRRSPTARNPTRGHRGATAGFLA